MDAERCLEIPFLPLWDDDDKGSSPEGMGGSVRSLRSVMLLRSFSALIFKRLAHCRRGWFYKAVVSSFSLEGSGTHTSVAL